LLIDFGFGQGATKEHTRLLTRPPTTAIPFRLFGGL